MKKCRIIIYMLLIISITFYLYIDGFIPYKIQKAVTPPLKLIEYYTGHDFPTETVIEDLKFYDTWGDPYEGSLDAVLIVPSNMINVIFTNSERNYDDFYACLIPKDIEEQFNFTVIQYTAVRRLHYMTSRESHIIVLKPEKETTRIYVSLHGLGWYEADKWKL